MSTKTYLVEYSVGRFVKGVVDKSDSMVVTLEKPAVVVKGSGEESEETQKRTTGQEVMLETAKKNRPA